jgi:class 3 adenylate cyclase/tetratricopeptide (TPR) repeat protein
MAICERCGTESPTGFRFCGSCGAPLTVAPPPADARKVVTALFCDIVGSTALGEELDPERLRDVIHGYFDAMRETIERYGGTVQKFAGDAVLAVFGVPQVREDDALRAVRAAVEIGERMPLVADSTGVELHCRTGINTGMVVSDQDRTLAIGDPINVAARLEQAAQPREILIGGDTLRLVRHAVEVEPLEPLSLKGKSEPVAAFRLLSVDRTAPSVARQLGVAIVDRARELGLLYEAWEATVAERDCHLLTVLGGAGVGKSRLVAELFARVGDSARILSGRCLPYGEGITFWPIAEALAPVGSPAHLVLEHMSRGGVSTPEELFWEIRRLLESLAAQRPVVLHIDDLQWGEPMLLELVAHIADLSRGSPILLVCTARPELIEEHPAWPAAKSNAMVLSLGPLGEADSEELVEQLDDRLGADVRARLIKTSEGNPLFLQEMIALAREHGEFEVPPTIQALLAARIERLTAEERELLERGAVEGEVFHSSVVLALGDAVSPAEVERLLASLVRKELIRPHPANVPGEEAFRFRHLLIRDAAYDRVPKARRATLHERYARWLDRAPVEFAEVDEIAGWHLEQVVRNEREVRRVVDAAVSRRAAERLYAAGRRAGDRGDLAAATNLLERALDVAQPSDQIATDVAVELAGRLIELGDLARANDLLTTVELGPGGGGKAALCRLEWLVLSQPEVASETIESQLPGMLEKLARVGDDRGVARARMLAFWVNWGANRATAAADQVRHAAEHARLAGDAGLRSRALGWYVTTLIYGPHPVGAMAAELEMVQREQAGPYLTACVDLCHAAVERLEGRVAEARLLTQRAIDGLAALGMRTEAASSTQLLARIELTAGDLEAARDALLRGDMALAAIGETYFRCTTQAILARVYELSGDKDAARGALEMAEQLSAPGDAINYAITHEVRARLALANGECDAAERWARSAVQHALRTDWVGVQADARLGLARVLSACGRRDEAVREARTTFELFDYKGDRPGGRLAQALLDELGALA